MKNFVRGAEGRTCLLRAVMSYGAIFLSLMVGLQAFTRAQTTTATLSGTVTDNKGAVVPAVAITV
ncbi:MAG: hypothetical protein J2P41_15135, partial [Blastocatellia bacterium]|nr:hypothetical protein [Blastocatellia bacterium]